jgi:hypothetical protein
MLLAIANAAPTVCGGGVYYYAGREVSAGQCTASPEL